MIATLCVYNLGVRRLIEAQIFLSFSSSGLATISGLMETYLDRPLEIQLNLRQCAVGGIKRLYLTEMN